MKEIILIIEDDKDIIKMLEYNLKKEGFKTLSASDGEDALDLAVRRHPDLVILDLMLPGMDGLEVCKNLKRDTKTASIPVIMLTAKSQESDKIVGLELGADDYMTKPFSPRELIARIRPLPAIGVTTAHLYFSNPAKSTDPIEKLFSTHPPIEERIRILEMTKGAA